MSAAGPLSGLTILDLTRVLSGPFCTMLLGDMGARVIKIEQPGRGDDTRAWGPPFVGSESAYFLGTNRNKESVTLDFKTREGRDILERLIARADVLVENFRPGTMARLHLDYAALAPRRAMAASHHRPTQRRTGRHRRTERDGGGPLGTGGGGRGQDRAHPGPPQGPGLG